MKKRMLSAVLSLVMCLSLLPAQALAVTEPAAESAAPAYPAIHAGVDGIKGWDAQTNTYDYIYYGNWQNIDQEAPHPLKWRVLDDETNMGTDNGLFLLSERVLSSSYMGIYFEQTGDVTGEKFETGLAGLKNLFDSIKDPSGADGALNIYQTYGYNTMYRFSDVYNWLTDFAGVTTGAYVGRDGKPYADVAPAFSSEELDAILETSKSDSGYIASKAPNIVGYQDTTACFPYADILQNDKVFLMSAEEAEAEKYGFGGSKYSEQGFANRYGKDYITEGTTNYFSTRTWLRSYVGYYPHPDTGKDTLGIMCQYYTGSVESLTNFEIDFTEDDALSGQSEAMTGMVRPAFNLNSSKVAFTPAADNSTHQDFGLVGTVSDKVWKVTLRDGNDFSDGASVSGNLVAPGGTLTINHKALNSFAGTGYTNVTAALIDEAGNVAAYGSINTDTAATASTCTIPGDLEEGLYTLSLQAEDWNDAYCTDFASAAFTAEITVADTHTHVNNTTNYITTEAQLAAMAADDCGFLIEDIVLKENTVYTGTLCLNGHKLTGDLSVSDLTLYDCKGTGSVDSVTVSGTLTLHTAPTITTGKLDLGAGGVVKFGKTLSVEKPYALQASGDHVFTEGWDTYMENVDLADVFATPLGYDVTEVNGEQKLTSRKHLGGNHGSCGVTCTHNTDHQVTGEWIEIKSYDELMAHSTQVGESASDRLLKPGNYYLLADLENAQVNDSNGHEGVQGISRLQIDGTVNLCLNGYALDLYNETTYYSDCWFEILNGGTLNLCDCGVTGTLKLHNTNSGHGAVYIDTGGTFNFYSGTISAKDIQTNDAKIGVKGTFNMYGGVVTDIFYSPEYYTGNYAVDVKDGGVFSVCGGEIVGSVNRASGSTVSISGKVNLGTETKSAFVAVRGENSGFTVSDLEAGSNIVLDFGEIFWKNHNYTNVNLFPLYDEPAVLSGMASYKDCFSLMEKFHSDYYYLDTDGDDLLIRRVKDPENITVETADGEAVTITSTNRTSMPLYLGQSKSFVINWTSEDAGYIPYAKASNGTVVVEQSDEQFTLTAVSVYEEFVTIREPIQYSAFGYFIVVGSAFEFGYNAGTGGTLSGTVPASTTISNIETAITLPGAIYTSNSATQYGWAVEDNGEKVFELGQTITAHDLADYHGEDGTVTLYPAWRLTSVTVNFNMQDHGSAVPNQTLTGGDKATKPADPTADGYTFRGWYTDAACTKAYDFNTPVNNHLNLYAKWDVNYYAVDFNANGHGTAPAWQRVAHGSKVTEPTAPTASGYVFGGWYTDAACTDGNAYDFNTAVTDHLHLYAKWTESAPVTYAVTVNGGSGGGQYEAGASVTITANDPETGKQFKEWTGADGLTFTSGSTTTATATFTMPANEVAVTATYEDIPVTTYAVAVTNGTGSGQYAEGASVTITANDPETGKQFKEWTGAAGLEFTSGSATSATATFTMPAKAVTVEAIYEDIPVTTYAVTVTNGTGSGQYAEGTSVTITADTAPDGQQFKEWSGVDELNFTSGSATTASATFTMPANEVTVTATYEDIPVATYAVTVTNGTGSGQYAEGASVTITADTAPDGQRFKEWTGVDGLTFTSGSATSATATFIMPANEVTVTATYEDIPVATYAVTVTNGTGSGQYAEGASVTITANDPETGKQFAGWNGADELNFTSGSATTATATFTMPAKAVTVTATYEDIPVATYAVTVTNGTGSGQYAEGASVTITTDTAPDGQRFKEWTGVAGLTFTGGSATTATATFIMPANEVIVEATYEDVPETPAALAGTVSIDGDAKFGSVLTANISGITNNTGTLSYQWKRGETDIGTNSSTYTLVEADIEKTITVTVTSSVESGEITSAATATIEKADGPAAPAGLTGVAPTTDGNADGKIINTAVDMEYSTDSSFAAPVGTACSETETTGLSAGTYYVRYKETTTHKAGAYATVVVPAYSADPVYSISLDTTGIYTFDTATVGYAAPTAKTVTVSNTGTDATGALTVALSGNDDSSFTLSKTSIADIAVSGNDTFTVVPNTGLAAGTYTATVTVSGGSGIAASFDVSFTVNAAASIYSIALSPSGTQTFAAATVGYGAQSAKTITVSNTGTGATGILTVALSGNNASSFELNKTSIADIAVSGSDTFTVVPKTGLSAGTYKATVTVSGNNSISASFNISFTVNSAGGGGNGGGGYTPPSTPSKTEVTVPISGDEETIHVDASVKGDTATIDKVDLNKLDTVIGEDVETGTVTIDFSGLDSSKPITTVEIPADVVKEVAAAVANPTNDAESLEIILSDGTSIEFDAEALGEKASQADGLDITISIERHEDVKITNAQKNAVGDRPAYDINVTSGGKHISDMGGKITVHAPYELKASEQARGIVVWYVDENGNRERCETSYDPIKQRVNWKTDHLSLYMIDHCPSATFTDLDTEAWYHEATDYALTNGLMGGYGNGYFGPNDALSRGMLVQILYNLEGKPAVGGEMPFTDVAEGKYYVDAIMWAQQNNIVGGYGNGLFGPDDSITREQLATILWRYSQHKGYDVSVGEDTNILSYEDAFDISEYAIPAMQWACGAGVMGGYGNGYLGPNDGATRAQTAQMLKNFMEKAAK